VTLTYYTPALLPDDAVLDLLDGRGRRLARVTGQMCWHPAMDKKRNRYGGFDPDSYPHYVIVRVDGTFEVIEHATYGAAFRISDDPELVQQARDAVGCAKE
jgi:hypothetical protein